MLRASITGFALYLICAHSLGAANPTDIDFRLRLASDSRVYRIGEPIELEISYSSQSVKKYETSRMTPRPDLETISPHLFPAEGVTDLREFRRDPRGIILGSYLSGGPEFLKPEPITERLDLSGWYRFQKPGHYSVTVTSRAVWRMRSLEEGGGREELSLESNVMEFDILPGDPSWESAELSNILQALNEAKYPGQQTVAIHRLAYLDTQAAIEKLTELFLSSSNDSDGMAMYAGLRESSRKDLIIPLLQTALSDPAATVSPWLAELLADLQTRKELGIQPPDPTDPAERSAWYQKMKERIKVRDKYFALANARLLASIDHRSGPLRAKAIYQAWSDAETLNMTSPQSAELLSHLLQGVFDVQQDLGPFQRLQFVTSAWQTMPHEQLLPIIRDLASDNRPEAGFSVLQAFGLWCKGWQSDCSAAILRRSSDSSPVISQHVFLMLAEAEHPELDRMLEEKLADTAFVRDGVESPKLAALVLRAGSRNLVPGVDAALDRFAADHRYTCESQTYLLGYLFRFVPEDANKRISEILQDATNLCGGAVLQFLDKSRYSDDLIPIAVQALDSPNLGTAATSATLLGAHAPESVKVALWHRLNALWTAWRGRAPELQGVSWGESSPYQTVRLEEALASAIANAGNWKLSQAERDRLRSGCLTEACRSIADGKMSISM